MNYKINYDYTDLIMEIEGKMKEDLLKENEIIQVLRGERLDDLYTPIIRWYYDKRKMKEYTADIINDSAKEKIKKIELKKEYLRDEPYLKNTTVIAMLIEIKEMNNDVRDV